MVYLSRAVILTLHPQVVQAHIGKACVFPQTVHFTHSEHLIFVDLLNLKVIPANTPTEDKSQLQGSILEVKLVPAILELLCNV